jgi:tetratricopeptide (TPR) repeat protein
MRSAALTAAVVAQVAALGEKRHEPDAAPSWRGRLAALAVAGAAPALALVLCAEGWRLARTESLRLGSQGEDGDARLALIEAATRAAPELADLHLEAARDYGRRYEQESAADPGRAAQDFLLPALVHYVQARDLCPLSAAAHLRLALHRGAFERADPADTYVARAECVLSSDPELYYLAGSLELANGDRARAMASWRRSLDLSDAFQKPIVERARGVLTDEELLGQVLPDRPGQLYAAAAQLHPESDAPGRRPFYEKALALLGEPGAARTAADFHLKAVLQDALDQPDEAVASYETAVGRAPQETEWRCEFVRLLRRQGRLEEARRQVRSVLADRPDHPEGLRLLHAIARDMAEKP